MDRPTYADAVSWLATCVPQLAPVLREHEREYDEVLPYVVFESGYMSWFERTVRSGGDAPAVQDFLRCIDVLLDGPADDVADLAGIGFVEHLVQGGGTDVLRLVDDALGPATRRALIAFAAAEERLGELARRFGVCRCRELEVVHGEATRFHREHLVGWADRGPGREVLKCQATGAFWSSLDRRAGPVVQMRRHRSEAAALEAVGRPSR